MGKKKQTVLETAILLTLITGAMFPVTGQATNRNVAQIGVDNAGKLITVGTETQWELEWNAIAKAPTSLKPFGVGYNQVDTSTSPTGLSVYADTVKIESTQAPRQSYGLSLNDTNPKGNAATAQNHTVNITAGNIAIKAEGGTNTRFGDMVAGVNTYYVPVNMKANNELTIAANNKNNANRSPASYVIQTDSAPVSLEASDITLSTKGKRLVRGIRVDTTQTDLPGSVTLQASGALHVQSELVDDSNVKSGVQQLYGIYLGTGTVTGTAKNISVAVNGAKGLSGASIRAIEIPGNKVGNASLSGERNLILQAEDTLSISAEGKGATTAINAHAIGTNSPEKTVLKGGTVTITSNGDSDKWGTVVGISNGSDGNENAAKGEMTITATKGLVTIQAESKNGGAQGIHTSNNAETNIKGNSVAVSAKANNATVVKGVWATSPLETPAQLTMTATSGKVTINSKSTSGAAVGI